MIPRDIGLVVGIPRSGLLPANLIALCLNVPLTDVDGLLAGREFSPGLSRAQFLRRTNGEVRRRVLVVDDSIYSGTQIQKVRNQIAEAGFAGDVVYAAVYARLGTENLVDLHFEVCPQPRMFEWNFMHHSYLSSACLDIDGVLCRDPRTEENDDGVRYREFLRMAEPFYLPTVPVGILVTCRLEKYRSETEAWLKRHQVTYESLVMMNLPSKEARQRAGLHAEFKAEVYGKSGKEIFIESDPSQAKQIADRSGRIVLCVKTLEVIYPTVHALIQRRWRKAPAAFIRLIERKLRNISASILLRTN